jgi:hypothetical protein
MERERKASLFHGRRKDVGEKKERSGERDLQTERCQGWVIEWFKVPVLKTGVLQKVPWVRIPLRPKDLPKKEREGCRRVSKSVEECRRVSKSERSVRGDV